MLPRNIAGKFTSKQAKEPQEREHILEESEEQKDDADLTLEEWIDIPREILTLKCNQLCLAASGSKTSLANRLFAYFAPGHVSTTRTWPAPDDRRRKSSAVTVPAIPDVPQASKDILKLIAPEIEKLISEELAATISKLEQQTKSKRKGVTSGSRPQQRVKRGRHRNSSLTSSSTIILVNKRHVILPRNLGLHTLLLLNCFNLNWLKSSVKMIQSGKENANTFPHYRYLPTYLPTQAQIVTAGMVLLTSLEAPSINRQVV